MAEQLAFAEQVHHPAAIHKLDRPPAYHSHLGLGLFPLVEDDRAAGEELDLGPLGEPLERRFVEPAERIVPT